MSAKVVDRHSTSKARLLRLLTELDEGVWCRRSVFLRPGLHAGPTIAALHDMPDDERQTLADIVSEIGPSDTGAAVFMGEGRATAVLPPFPFDTESHEQGVSTIKLRNLLERELLIGVVLLRMGRYAVAVLRGKCLSASKTDTRHVKNRHRAGGSSQRRFMRSRDRLVRELYDKTCEVVRDVFEPFGRNIDYVLLGGERNTLRAFRERCRLLQDLGPKVLNRTLQMDRPNHATLEGIAFEVWKSRVLTLELND